MAFALPAAATAVAAAAPAAVAKATIMATLKSVAFKAITNLAISAAMSALQPQVGGQSGRTFEFVIDPDGPIPFAAGRVGVAGSVIHRDTFGPDLMYYGMPFVLSGAGPITAIESFMADDYPMSFDANGGATTEPYRQELFFRSVLGHQPASAALTTPSGLKNGATLPGWTSAHKLSGKAAGLIVMAENSKGSAFPTGEIKPLIQMLGLKGWDPTLDSTYPGGSGPCRLHDPSTWVTLTCPILWALKWSLGLWEGPNGKGAPQVDHQVGGIGAKLSGIDVPAFVAASNIAKANGWTVSAYPNTDDDKHQVLEAFLQAGGAIYSQRAGKISCISRAAPRTSIVTISAADTAGPLEIDAAASRIDRINTIRPRFWSPAHRWQMTAMEEVTAASYQTEDGGKRTRGIDYPFVSNAKQAGQLAALQIANTREGIAGVIPLKPHLQRIRPGDAFTITEAGFVLNGLKCLCLNTDYDPATGVVRVSFVSETDGKYPFALGQSPIAPTPQVLTPVDPKFVTPPTAAEWSFNGATFTDNGLSIPGIVFSGDVDNATAQGVLFEYRPETSAGWSMAGEEGPLVERKEVTSVTPGTRYYGSVRYRRGSNFSERLILGPATAGVFSLEAQPFARDLAKGGFGSTSDMPKSSNVTYSTPNGTGQLRVTYPATGTSAYFGWTLGRPGAKAYVIRARVRAAADPIMSAHWDGRLTYATAALAHSLTAGRMASLAFPGGITAEKWRVLEWEADGLTDYLTSTIDSVRLYLLKPGAPPIDIDWLEVGYREGATANTGKLADQDNVDFDADIVGPGKPVSGAGKIFADAVNTNLTPAGYAALLPTGGTRLEIKDAASLGNARAAGNTVVQTDAPASGWAGVVQVMRTPTQGSFKRSASTATAWRGWMRAYDEEQKPLFGYDLEETPGVLATVAAYKTSVGTSAFVDNQGALATKDQVDFDSDVGGANKPQPGAGRVFNDAINTNTTPGAYRTLVGSTGGVRVEIKDAATLGNSRATGTTIVTTEVPPGSSGYVVDITQTMRTPAQGSFKRRASSATAWLGWTRSYDEEQKPIFGFDLEETAGVLATVANYKTSQGTSAFVNNQGTLATNDSVHFGSSLIRESSGGAAATLAQFKTSQGTAAYLNNQGSLATKSSVDYDAEVIGLYKPAAGAGLIFDGAQTTNSPPSYYLGLFPQGGIRAELKMPASLGNSRGGTVASVTTTEARAGSYVGMVQIQRTPTNGVFKREAYSNTSWGGWTKSYDEDVKPRFGSDLLKSGGSVATEADFETGLGTAKFIENQGPAATGSDADYKTSVGYAAGMNGEPLNGSGSVIGTPAEYRALGRKTYNERKAASVAGGSGGQYGDLITHVVDTRPDRPTIQQFIFNTGLVYQRHSINDDAAWSPWSKSYNQDQKPTFGDGIPRNAASGNGVALTPTRPLAPVSGYADTRISVAATSAKFGDGSTLSLPSATLTGLTSNTGYAVFRRFSTNSYVATASAATRVNYQTDDDYLLLGIQVTAATSGGSYSPPPPAPPGGGGGYGNIPLYVE